MFWFLVIQYKALIQALLVVSFSLTGGKFDLQCTTDIYTVYTAFSHKRYLGLRSFVIYSRFQLKVDCTVLEGGGGVINDQISKAEKEQSETE